MISYDYITKQNIEKHNPSWFQVLNHTYRMLIIVRSGSEATNAFFNLMKQQDNDDYKAIDKIYLYLKDPNEAKDQHLFQNVKTAVLNDWKIQRLLLNIKIIKTMSRK